MSIGVQGKAGGHHDPWISATALSYPRRSTCLPASPGSAEAKRGAGLTSWGAAPSWARGGPRAVTPSMGQDGNVATFWGRDPSLPLFHTFLDFPQQTCISLETESKSSLGENLLLILLWNLAARASFWTCRREGWWLQCRDLKTSSCATRSELLNLSVLQLPGL